MSTDTLDRVIVIDSADGDACPAVPLVEPGEEGEARAVVWPGMGARDRSMHRVRLGAGARTIRLEHPGEAVWYVVEGDGQVTGPDGEEAQPLDVGAMVHAEAGDAYRLVAGKGGMTLAGGPCPPDPALYASLGLEGV